MVTKSWDYDLTRSERRLLLAAAYPNGSKRVQTMESGLTWVRLLPSTQMALRGVDWCAVLDRDVRPD